MRHKPSCSAQHRPNRGLKFPDIVFTEKMLTRLHICGGLFTPFSAYTESRFSYDMADFHKDSSTDLISIL